MLAVRDCGPTVRTELGLRPHCSRDCGPIVQTLAVALCARQGGARAVPSARYELSCTEVGRALLPLNYG